MERFSLNAGVKSACAAAATAILAAGAVMARPDPLQDLDKKMRTSKKDLKQIEDKIRTLEDEGERLRKSESSINKTIKELESKIENSTRRQVQQKRTIRETEARVSRLQEQTAVLSTEGKMWEQVVFADLKTYHTRAVFPARLSRSPMEERVLRSVIALRIEQIKDTHSRRQALQEKEKDLTVSKTKLVKARAEMEQEISVQKKSKDEKRDMLKTTQGKRLIAEQEAQKLKETREELEKLIGGLADKKKKTLAAQREAELLKKSFDERRGTLPWPLTGPVTVTFGRHKHPDLNITVISNGIKIKAAANEPVKSVAKGTVVYSSDFRSYGRTVIVDHVGYTFSVYGLLGDLTVKEGEKVAPGKIIGTAPDETASQIYFEIKNRGRSENPLNWLSPR